jgi:hypothetical protein
MLFLYGCPLSHRDAIDLVEQLLGDGSDDAVQAAGQIQYALLVDRVVVGLAPHHRDAVLETIEDGSSDEFSELRASLRRDHEYRYSLTR